MSNRNPFPSPRCENDFTLGGSSAQQGEVNYNIKVFWTVGGSQSAPRKPNACTGRTCEHREAQYILSPRKEENLKQELLEKESKNTTRVWTDPQRCSIYSIK